MVANRKPRPIRRLHIPLDHGYYITVVFWRSQTQLQEATRMPKDMAVTECEPKGNCVARVHLSREALDAGTIGHEIRHAIDHYHDRLNGEHLAQMTDRCLNAVHEAVEEIE